MGTSTDRAAICGYYIKSLRTGERSAARQVAPHIAEQAKQFIDRNRQALLDYWECKIDTAQLVDRLR